jgi:hypothetical protein
MALRPAHLLPPKRLLTPRLARRISPTNRGLLPGAPVPTGTGLSPASLIQLSGHTSVYTLMKLLGHESMATSQRYVAGAARETRVAAAQNPLYGFIRHRVRPSNTIDGDGHL